MLYLPPRTDENPGQRNEINPDTENVAQVWSYDNLPTIDYLRLTRC